MIEILAIFVIASIAVCLMWEVDMWKKIKDWLMDGYERVRARDIRGRYVKDNPSTKKNEAYTLRKKKSIKK